jgi:SAM-dependent methyltransferase
MLVFIGDIALLIMFFRILPFHVILASWFLKSTTAFSKLPPSFKFPLEKKQNLEQESKENNSLHHRREFIKTATLIVLFPFTSITSSYAIRNGMVQKLSSSLPLLPPPQYPPEHEQRVSRMIRETWMQSAAAIPQKRKQTSPSSFRVLEVGFGSDCRLLRRGLYDPAIQHLAQSQLFESPIYLSWTGIDLLPTQNDRAGHDAAEYLKKEVTAAARSTTTIPSSEASLVLQDVQFVQGDIVNDTQEWEEGSFDVILCCFTLCSVQDPQLAVRAIKRLLRPSGGCFGYVEHVAVRSDEHRAFLSWQQQTLDPLQQLLADNCHLHRDTESTLNEGFSNEQHSMAKLLFHERFFVDSMWPISCQCCGVLQLNT